VGSENDEKCDWCENPAEYFCDHPLKDGEGSPARGVCDRPCCPDHATEVGDPVLFLCPDHAPPGGA
jgi:hypothetical protein